MKKLLILISILLIVAFSSFATATMSASNNCSLKGSVAETSFCPYIELGCSKTSGSYLNVNELTFEEFNKQAGSAYFAIINSEKIFEADTLPAFNVYVKATDWRSVDPENVETNATILEGLKTGISEDDRESVNVTAVEGDKISYFEIQYTEGYTSANLYLGTFKVGWGDCNLTTGKYESVVTISFDSV